MNIGPNVNDQSWQWLMQWVREIDGDTMMQLADDYQQPAVLTAYLRGRHSVYKELLRFDTEAREGDVANMLSTSGNHEV